MLSMKFGSEVRSNVVENPVALPHLSNAEIEVFHQLEPYAQDHPGEGAQHRKSLSGAEDSTNRLL
jgi:hypothetical protein